MIRMYMRDYCVDIVLYFFLHAWVRGGQTMQETLLMMMMFDTHYRIKNELYYIYRNYITY